MTKSDDKGEPVKTVTIGGKKVEVPIIFVLPEEVGEKEIERYQHPKVHIESKKVAPLLAGAGAATGVGAAAGGVAATGKKIGEGVKNTVGEGIGAVGDAAKLSETLSSESEEKPLEELTHGKLEEVEKLPFPVPKEKVGTQRDSKGKIIRVGDMLQSDIDERDALYRHATGSGFPQELGVKDSIVAGKEEMPKQKEISHETAEANKAKKKKKKKLLELNEDFFDDTISRVGAVKGGFQLNYDDFGEEFEAAKKKKKKVKKGEENTPYFNLLSPEKPKKKKKKRGNSYEELLSAEKDCGCGHSHKKRKRKGLDSGDDDPRRHGRRPRDRDPDEDVGQHEGRERGHKPDQHKPKRSTIDRLREHQADIKSGKWKPPNDDDIVSLVEDYDEHTDQEKLDIELARRGGKGGKIALPMVERKVRGEKRPSLYGETVGRRSLQAGLTPEQAGQNMHMATISEENAEKYKAWLQKRDDWDEEESDMTDAYFGRKKKKKKKLQDANFDDTPLSGEGSRDSYKSFDSIFKDALDASENTGEFKQWGKTPDKRSGRDPKTSRTKIDYLQDRGVYSAGGQAMGKREPQTSRGQADDATQDRVDRYTGHKYHPRQSGQRDSMDFGRLSQHENVLLSPSASDTGWAEGRERDVPKHLWDDGDRKVPKGGKRPVEGKPKLGKPAGRTGNEKLIDVMTGNDEAAAETYDKEDERRRAERFGQDKRGNLITGSKAPKTKPSKKPSKDKKPERTYPKKAWEKWLENKSLGALGWGKLDRKTGKKKKLRRRQPTLDDFPEDNGDKKNET